MANLKILALLYISAGVMAPFSVGEFYRESSSFVLTDTYRYLRLGLLAAPIAISYIFFWDLIKRKELKRFNKSSKPFFPKLDPSRTKKNMQIFFALLVLSLIAIYSVFLFFNKPDFILPFIVSFYLFVIGFGYLLGIFVFNKSEK